MDSLPAVSACFDRRRLAGSLLLTVTIMPASGAGSVSLILTEVCRLWPTVALGSSNCPAAKAKWADRDRARIAIGLDSIDLILTSRNGVSSEKLVYLTPGVKYAQLRRRRVCSLPYAGKRVIQQFMDHSPFPV